MDNIGKILLGLLVLFILASIICALVLLTNWLGVFLWLSVLLVLVSWAIGHYLWNV